MDELHKNDALTLLGKCFLDLSKEKSWWYSIHDPNDESSISSTLYLKYTDYTSIFSKIGLL